MPAVDVAPPGQFSCAEQQAWGMCDALNGTAFCYVSCELPFGCISLCGIHGLQGGPLFRLLRQACSLFLVPLDVHLPSRACLLPPLHNRRALQPRRWQHPMR